MSGEHVHDASCAFGNPTCPAFCEPPRTSRDPRRWPLAEFLTVMFVTLGFIALFGAAVLASR